MMKIKVIGVVMLATLLLGCQGEGPGEAPVATKPPTEADFSKMPPEAAAHARGMQAYGQALQQSNANQHKDSKGP